MKLRGRTPKAATMLSNLMKTVIVVSIMQISFNCEFIQQSSAMTEFGSIRFFVTAIAYYPHGMQSPQKNPISISNMLTLMRPSTRNEAPLINDNNAFCYHSMFQDANSVLDSTLENPSNISSLSPDTLSNIRDILQSTSELVNN